MARVKTFVNDGTIPNGRIYAGDLNAMQDAAAALSDFLQNIDLAAIRIGESGLSLLRYGAGEARLTGMLRVDGIFRPLGGLIPGAFTTATRDAIPVGGAPTGVIIFNSDIARFQWNVGTDGARAWRNIGDAQAGAFAVRPAAGLAGRQYWDSTNGILWIDTGTTWTPSGSPFASGSLPATPQEGQEAYLTADAANGVAWHFKYRAANPTATKWEFIGGPDMRVETAGLVTTTDGAAYSAVGPSATVPRTGVYDVSVEADSESTNGQSTLWISPTSSDAVSAKSFGGRLPQRKSFRMSLSSGQTLTMAYRNFGIGTGGSAIGNFRDRVLAVRPVMVS